jgi:predicted pyridoxine 5'-phosphate oxidase superfamily flavin-nucleotide-binding protein
MTDHPRTDTSPFHAGELAIQDAAGVRARAAQLGPMFRPAMAEPYRAFFERLPFVLTGSVDSEGQPWASMLIGAPGFIRSPDPETLLIVAQPHPDDPLASAIREGAALGLLGIELEARRRARVNGHVHEVGSKGFSLSVDQSFGNCSKYITPRTPGALGVETTQARAVPESSQLSATALACIARSDTCFIASASAVSTPEGDRREGVDVSHRGGERGFVQVGPATAETQLFMPDYPGNNAFNTLGNLARYPRAGLLFPSFDDGDVLLVTCDAEISFADRALDPTAGARLAQFAGAKRLVTFSVREGLYFPRFMPFYWAR